MVQIRKIETKEEIEKREKNKTRMIVALTLLLLLGSTAGYAFLSSEKTSSTSSSIKGINEIGGQWAADFNGQTLVFSNHPNVTEITKFNLTYNIASYNQKPVYISANDSRAKYEIATTLGQYASRFQEACYGNCSLDLPEKTCNDFLIVLNDANLSEENGGKVYQKDNCVFIDGDLGTVDAFLYRIFGLA